MCEYVLFTYIVGYAHVVLNTVYLPAYLPGCLAAGLPNHEYIIQYIHTRLQKTKPN